jgi:23S rRNA pseudouridine2605 synthase
MKAGNTNKKTRKTDVKSKKAAEGNKSGGPIRLNRFISMSGLCSRRKADELISEGKVKVNGKVVLEMGHKVNMRDKVLVNNQLISPEKKQYILLNKPKGTICTKSDPNNRKTVIDLLPDDLKHMNPVGRLDRNTTGVLILTNDGELTQNLIHPSKKIKKIYKATLNEHISQEQMNLLVTGVELEDGISMFDKLVDLNEDEKPRYGIEIHSGKNRVIRRMFEAVGVQVIKLDRVLFHNIERRGLKRGEWRFLRDKELKGLGLKV